MFTIVAGLVLWHDHWFFAITALENPCHVISWRVLRCLWRWRWEQAWVYQNPCGK